MIGGLSLWFIHLQLPLAARCRGLRLGRVGSETARPAVETHRKIDRKIIGALRIEHRSGWQADRQYPLLSKAPLELCQMNKRCESNLSNVNLVQTEPPDQ